MQEQSSYLAKIALFDKDKEAALTFPSEPLPPILFPSQLAGMKPDGSSSQHSQTTRDNSRPFLSPSATDDNFCCGCPDTGKLGCAQNSNHREKMTLPQGDTLAVARGNPKTDSCHGNFMPKAGSPSGALCYGSLRDPCLPGDNGRDKLCGHLSQRPKERLPTKPTTNAQKGFPNKDIFLFGAKKADGGCSKATPRTPELPQLAGESLSPVSKQEVGGGKGRGPAASSSPETIHRRTRRDLFQDSKGFRELDAHVLRVSEQLKSKRQPLSVQTLVPVITKAAQSQLETVRAIWMWLCHNIKYDVDGFLGLSEKIHRPEQVLLTERGVCSGYAHLCHEMCKEAGVTCVEVSGYGRGAGCHRGGQTCLQKKSNHMWNAVKLGAQWFLLDACWGAGLVEVEEKLFIPRHDDFFFLTDPQHFVETHWPDEPAWQLLQPPLSLENFEDRVFKTPEFFKLQLSLLSPDTSVLKTEHGEATVSVESALSAEFTYQLLKICHDDSKDDLGKTHGMLMLSAKRMVLKVFPPTQGLFDLQIFARLSGSQAPCSWVCSQQIECPQPKGKEELPENPFSFWGLHPRAKEFGIEGCNWEEAPTIATTGRLKLALQTKRPLLATYELVHRGLDDPLSKKCLLSQAEEERLTCHILCPFAGYYRLSVFVKGLEEEEEFQNMANLLLDCCSPLNQNELFPLGLSSTHCGTGMSSQGRGLSSPSHTAPIIHTKQGRCNITFHTQPGFEITATLSKDTLRNKTYPLERYTLVTHLEDKVSICIRLPESGLYRVGLYGRNADCNEFTHVCDYVVRCFTNPQWPPFPRVYSLWRRGCVLLQPRTGALPAQSWERFRIKLPKDAYSALVVGHAKTELKQGQNKVWEGDVYTGSAGTMLKVAVKFAREASSLEVILSFDVEGSSTISGDPSG